MSDKGVLIVIEGIDGAGKSTQTKSLLRKLRAKGLPAVYFREPSRGKWGRELKRLAQQAGSLTPEQELELFQKDRRENVEKNLRPALAAGKVIVLDRYFFSTIAYQGAKGLDRDRIRRMNERFAPKPDLVFILDIRAGEGLARISGRRKKDVLFERESYLAKVRRIFLSFRGARFVQIDARQSRRDVARQIYDKTMLVLSKKPSCS
ncbi:MAG: dTMP kinase [Candidatus Aminicenantes bacterium]|nr:dTMP kinase [Candidatus Aminicenantes bacterium]